MLPARAGVSVATASRVLNGSDLVTEATRKRVLKVVDELEFTPSPAARRLSLGRTLTISVVISFLTRPQAAERLRGVDAVLSDSEFDLVIYNVETVEKRDQYLRSLPLAQRTDGLFLISLPPRPKTSRGSRPRRCRSSLSTSTRRRCAACRASSATTSPAGSWQLGICSSLGHRSIGFIGDAIENPFGFTSSRDRFAGYERALAGVGLAPRPEWIALGAHGRYEARDLAHRLLSGRRPSDGDLRGVSDTQALGVIAAARELRPRRPGRPVDRRLRRHRGRRLRRADDHPPAALRIRTPRRGTPAQGDRAALRHPHLAPTCRPSSWSARRRRPPKEGRG